MGQGWDVHRLVGGRRVNVAGDPAVDVHAGIEAHLRGFQLLVDDRHRKRRVFSIGGGGSEQGGQFTRHPEPGGGGGVQGVAGFQQGPHGVDFTMAKDAIHLAGQRGPALHQQLDQRPLQPLSDASRP